MSILSELNTLISEYVDVQTGLFSESPKDEYAVITPISENFVLYADNKPIIDVADFRISLFSKGNYNNLKDQIVTALLEADFYIFDRRYINYESDTGYHHFAIDCGKEQ